MDMREEKRRTTVEGAERKEILTELVCQRVCVCMRGRQRENKKGRRETKRWRDSVKKRASDRQRKRETKRRAVYQISDRSITHL